MEETRKQFNLVAKEYDVNRRKFIPCYDDYYIRTTDFLAKTLDAKPSTILDLGVGTGLLSSYWYLHFPNAKFILLDIADEMLSVAKKRFQDAKSITFVVSDYTKSFPDEEADLIISALSVHHLAHNEKRRLFSNICQKLPKGGIFINYDQFCSDDNALNEKIESYWISEIQNSGISSIEYEKWLERKKLDNECSVSQEIEWLKEAGFKSVDCVYSCGKFGIIRAGKNLMTEAKN